VTSTFGTARGQRAVGRKVIVGRYLVIGSLGLVSLVPDISSFQYWAAAAMLLIGLPYNGVYDLLHRRTGELQPSLVFSDPLAVVLFVAVLPAAFPAAALMLLAMTAQNVVVFGRRLAMQAGIVSFIGVTILVVVTASTDALASLLILGVVGAFTIYAVGLIVEDERHVRERYTDLMSNLDAVVWERRRGEPASMYVSEEASRLLGYSYDELRTRLTWEQLVHPDDRATMAAQYRQAMHTGELLDLTYRMTTSDGRTIWVQDRVRTDFDAQGRWTRMSGVLLDVSAMKETERQVGQMVDLVNSIRLALLVLDVDDEEASEPALRVVAMNPAAAELAGVRSDEIVGRVLRDDLTIAGLDLSIPQLADVIRTGTGFTIDEHRSRPDRDDDRVFSVFAFPLPDRTVAVALNDITDRTNAAEGLRRQALHDALTGLPNRVFLNERVRNSIKRAHRDEQPIALLLMDLDQFKEVNDALGHDQGDKLLIEVSRRLQRVVREADTIARLGGDEFAVLLTDQADEGTAMVVAHRIRAALDEPFQLDGITLQTNASIGIAIAPEHGDDAETLAQHADIAMYLAKRIGAGAAVYAPEHDQSSVRRLALLGELRNAISEDDLVLHYQPCLDLATGEVRSVEALVRWNHRELGLLPPAEFIELAEVSGMIRPLTRWVIEHVLAQARVWQDEGLELTIGVNLSVKDLYDRDLVPWLADRLLTFGVDARRLKLELTESQLMDDPLLALEVLGKLKALGTTTSIDDFGTGYSSLAYLKHLPIDELKIDKSFIGNLVHDAMDLMIVRSTIDLSHNLGLSVVAEGVEDGHTLGQLHSLGCDRVQGYHVSPALPAAELAEWLAAWPDIAIELDGIALLRTPAARPRVRSIVNRPM
jgi:diguanylate cyclase (GGDEF)-like protein/PAS domain S-box-containing protein